MGPCTQFQTKKTQALTKVLNLPGAATQPHSSSGLEPETSLPCTFLFSCEPRLFLIQIEIKIKVADNLMVYSKHLIVAVTPDS